MPYMFINLAIHDTKDSRFKMSSWIHNLYCYSTTMFCLYMLAAATFFLKNNFTILLLFCFILLSEWMTL